MEEYETSWKRFLYLLPTVCWQWEKNGVKNAPQAFPLKAVLVAQGVNSSLCVCAVTWSQATTSVREKHLPTFSLVIRQDIVIEFIHLWGLSGAEHGGEKPQISRVSRQFLWLRLQATVFPGTTLIQRDAWECFFTASWALSRIWNIVRLVDISIHYLPSEMRLLVSHYRQKGLCVTWSVSYTAAEKYIFSEDT